MEREERVCDGGQTEQGDEFAEDCLDGRRCGSWKLEVVSTNSPRRNASMCSRRDAKLQRMHILRLESRLAS
jgi:hypothetical protein